MTEFTRRSTDGVVALSVALGAAVRRSEVVVLSLAAHRQRRRLSPFAIPDWSGVDATVRLVARRCWWPSGSRCPSAPSSISSSDREAIGFSVSEVPTAIALVFLAPGPAIGARLVGSALVLVLLPTDPAVQAGVQPRAVHPRARRRRSSCCGRLPRTDRNTDVADIVVATIIAMVVSSLLGSVLVSVAISLFEGDMLDRITSEFRLAWWLFVVNSDARRHGRWRSR